MNNGQTISGVYKITSPSNKVYIGQAFNIYQRWNRYKNLNCKYQPRLYNSLLKHGYNNHDLKIVEECIIDDLNKKERYWQEYYNVLGEQGLNCQYVDVKPKSKKLSQYTKDKISKSRIGIKLSDKHKQAISKGNKGKRHTKEAIDKIRKSKLGKLLSEKHKIAINKRKYKKIIDIKTNVIYDSIKEASIKLDINYSTLSGYLRGIRKNKTNLKFLNY